MSNWRFILAAALLAHGCGTRHAGPGDDNGENRNPVASAGGDRSARPGQVLTFDASASSDSDGDIVDFRWAFGDGSLEEHGEIVEHTFTSNGTYGVLLTVTDNDAGKATDSAIVTVDETNPIAAFSVSTDHTEVGIAISFDASASTAVSTLVDYRWTFGDSTTDTGVTVDHIYDIPGQFRVRLAIEDDQGRIGEAEQLVTIDPAPVAGQPVAAFSTSLTEAEVGVAITFDASASTADSPIVSYSWDFKDSTTDNGQTVTHAFDIPGTFQVELTVEDDQARTGRTNRTVTILSSTRNPPVPVLTASPPESPGATVGTAVSFDASASTADGGSIVAYRWVFGDSSCTTSTCPTTAVVQHTFDFAGSFHVVVEVEDDIGLTAQADLYYTVTGSSGTNLDVAGAFNIVPVNPSDTSKNCGSYSIQLTDTIVTFNAGTTTDCTGGGQDMTGFGLNGTSYAGCINGDAMSISAVNTNYAAGAGCTTTRTTTLNMSFSDVDNFTGTEVIYHDGVVGCGCSWIVPVVGTRRP